MDEITLDDKVYVSSKRAARITGYAKDYVGQLCREGRVEARLVGRNWYVLESSIRAHRFGVPASVAGSGKGEASDPFESETSTWQPSKYISEEIAELPTLTSTPPSVNPISIEMPISESSTTQPANHEEISESINSSVVSEMQSAWHDWFSRTNELAVSEEILLESPEDSELSLEASQEVSAESIEPIQEQVPVNVVRRSVETVEPSETVLEASQMFTSSYDDASEKEDEYIERVPLKRSYRATQSPTTYQPAAQDSHQQFRIESIQTRTSDIKGRARQDEPEGRIIRERRVKQPKGKPSIVLQVLMLSVACLTILIALIGTGELDTLFSRENLNYKVIDYLAGKSSFEKPN